MPIYEYRCDDCEALVEVFQKMSDDPLETCERCGGALRKVLHPVAIHFKGSGFYTTDYGRGSGKRPARESSDAAARDEGGTAASDTSTAASDATGTAPEKGARTKASASS